MQHLNLEVARLDDLLATSTASPISGSPWPGPSASTPTTGNCPTTASPRPGFELEVGWNPVVIAPELEATWEPSHYQGISLWGHTVVGENVATVMSKFQAAVHSLREREETVPALSTIPKGAHR